MLRRGVESRDVVGIGGGAGSVEGEGVGVRVRGGGGVEGVDGGRGEGGSVGM